MISCFHYTHLLLTLYDSDRSLRLVSFDMKNKGGCFNFNFVAKISVVFFHNCVIMHHFKVMSIFKQLKVSGKLTMV